MKSTVALEKQKNKTEINEGPAYYLDLDKKRSSTHILDSPLLYLKVN
ncbi:hypothetical protein [Sulfuracidifex tepidarius]|uniref:Uncharacterized protein n=1 Tax=Sulfuracidifex tepidarius TaxID=1294262 RepID=A0A510DXG8_9CREN|nr:hypothetical protein [Sulfuracidifex tepidarius]BBG24869.1 hypothetical protein IC006_2203 [Sulfuracidifex tepidarius]BBG27654.1 hypothetical protein IC007_2208 [Sulfuracidifex tepidarius]